MFLSLVNAVPIGALVVIVVALVVGLTLLGVRLVRRRVPATWDGCDAEVSSQLLGGVAPRFGGLGPPGRAMTGPRSWMQRGSRL